MSETERVEVPRRVYCELRTLRQMGVDPTDPDAVVATLDDYDFDAALDWVLENPETYVRAVRRGMVDETVPDDGDSTAGGGDSASDANGPASGEHQPPGSEK